MTDSTHAPFEKQVAAAYQHLYDLVWLRTSPLTDALERGSGERSSKEKAWALHNLLLATIEELAPEAQLPPSSREWRRFQLLSLRFVDGLAVDVVAADLGVSRREYFREQKRALAAAALVLSERLIGEDSLHQPAGDVPPQHEADRRALLEAEATHASGSERTADLSAALRGVVAVLSEVSRERGVVVSLPEEDAAHWVDVEPNLLRQLLMASIGYLIERCRETILALSVASGRGELMVTLSSRSVGCSGDQTPVEMEELAALTGCQVEVSEGADGAMAMSLRLPARSRPVVLIVDDNADALELMRRYLGSDYAVVTAQSVTEAWEAIRRLHPSAIILDLMMPERDGWDLLQGLANGPDTSHIPVVVCSVLKQRSLALAMGACAFVEKPVTERGIIDLLHGLVDDAR